MRFGPVSLEEAEGAILAHAHKLPDGRLAKGTRLGPGDLARLAAAGTRSVVAAVLEEGDVSENAAAGRIAEALAGSRIGAAPAATGRANLFAGEAGLFLPDRALIDAVNRVDPGITLATLGPYAPVEAGRMVATVKIIPLAVPGTAVDTACRLLRNGPALRLAPFRARQVTLVQTTLPGVKASVLDKTRRALQARLAPSGSAVVEEARCPHEPDALAAVLRNRKRADLVVIFGASAVIDEADVVPAAIRAAGGTVRHLGMPVDPGNLLLLAALAGNPVIGAPGCARSPAENGFDWVLDRVLADLDVTGNEITGLGVGGLLTEIASRPKPRLSVGQDEARPRVDVLLLAAGRSSRMNGPNKLLAEFDGVPLVRRSAETALASRAGAVRVVVGHMREAVGHALAGLDVEIIENPNYADGLSSSLKAGFAASGTADGVLVMLADQPLLTPAHLDRMIGAFRPAGGGSIVLASDEGRRANPVILASGFAEEIAAITGDVGARGVVAAHPEAVREVELGPAASLDVDTPETLARAGGRFAEAEPAGSGH